MLQAFFELDTKFYPYANMGNFMQNNSKIFSNFICKTLFGITYLTKLIHPSFKNVKIIVRKFCKSDPHS